MANKITIQSEAVYLSTAEAADFLRRSPVTLQQWRWAGTGPAYFPGKPVLYLRSDLEAWMRAKRFVPEFTREVA